MKKNLSKLLHTCKKNNLIPTEKKNIEDFYYNIRYQFPKLRELDVWFENDWSMNGSDTSTIMTELSKEMSKWASAGRFEETQRLMDFIEKQISESDERVTSFIYTDFLVTIMEIQDKEVRELIKKMMKPETAKHYKHLFNFYRETP